MSQIGPSQQPTQHSPLHDLHVAAGAKFAEFGGWSMPLEYPDGVLAEHNAVREQVGLFDVSHLGKLTVTGPSAVAFINRCLSNDLDKVGTGGAQYTLCCTETGGVVDDLIAYRYGDDEVGLVPNAANSAEVARRLREGAPESVEVRDRHRELAILAVQGTSSDEVLTAIGLPAGHDYMTFLVTEYAGEQVTVCRTGYTGERGYELIVPAAAAPEMWQALLAAGEPFGIRPCGLGARDTLRTEMGYPLHGQDLSPSITANQARLGWAVGWKKEAFWGREALAAEKAEGPAVLLRGLRATGRGIPRPGMRVLLTAHLPIGTVTSGTFSPTLRTGVALALIDAQVTEGAEVLVDVRGRTEVFTVVRPPFVTPGVRET